MCHASDGGSDEAVDAAVDWIVDDAVDVAVETTSPFVALSAACWLHALELSP